MGKIVNLWELEKSNEVANYYSTISAQETANKPTNKQSNLLNLTVSCEKSNCLKRKKKKVKRK